MLVWFTNNIAGDSKILEQADVCDKDTCRDQLCKSISMLRPNVIINACYPVTGEVGAHCSDPRCGLEAFGTVFWGGGNLQCLEKQV